MSHIAVLTSVGTLSLFQAANSCLDLFKHCTFYVYDKKLRSNSFGYVMIKIVVNILLYLVLGVAIAYLASYLKPA
ncbi:IMV membrane protein [Nile crocodilepox virus]|uniref:IMV membrane protein n=1 Tax=Nile crocodilepox virus (isolate Crocodylus niloticus/Zimbabwe/Ume/2001) TaxID=1289473 RepID=Q070C1_CPRVZ|nr:IMV membrane protein [Nile crocodilepox virus]ABJ09021.1 IMV membrane protein [Nile crocodilepox virus]